MQHPKYVIVEMVLFQLACWKTRQPCSPYVGPVTSHGSASPSRCLKLLGESFVNVGKLYFALAERLSHGRVPLCGIGMCTYMLGNDVVLWRICVHACIG